MIRIYVHILDAFVMYVHILDTFMYNDWDSEKCYKGIP